MKNKNPNLIIAIVITIIILGVSGLSLYSYTNKELFLYLSILVFSPLVIFGVGSMIYAWIIHPVKYIVKKFFKK